MTGAKTKEDDFIEHLFVASSHDYFLFFTSRGRLYCKKVHEIPEGSRTSRGKAIVNLLDLQTDEKVATILSVRSFEEGSYLIMATKNGVVKKTPLVSYSRPRSAGLAAITIREEDELIGTRVTNGSQNIFLTTKNGMSIRFPEEDVRPTGRGAMGIRGIRLYEGDEVVSMEALSEGAILTVTENGYGKRTATGEYRRQTRGGKGVRTIKTSERNGKVVYAYQVTDQDQLMIMTEQGKIIRVRIEDISVIGRNTQGVRLINLSEGEKVVAVAKVVEESSAL